MDNKVWTRRKLATCLVLVFVATITPQCPGATEPVEVREFGELACIKDGEFRLGGVHRMFLIEDQWEWDRCKRLIPDLPTVDLKQESLLVIVSFAKHKRTFEGAVTDGEQLVINAHQPPAPAFVTMDYHPPKFIVASLPAWPGPVRFEVNGHPQFTILRGAELERKVSEIWEEILRLHSGGRLSGENYIRYFQERRPEPLTEDEIREIKTQYFQKMKTSRPLDGSLMYGILFGDLANLQAKSAVPRIFKLIDTMGQHDKAFDPAWKALVAIGGKEVVEGCQTALEWENPPSRSAAALVLRDIADPETRTLAHSLLEHGNGQLVRLAVDLLRRLGLKREDVPPLVLGVERIEAQIFERDASFTRPGGFSSDDIDNLLYALGSLGSDAEEALPTLDRIAKGHGYPSIMSAPEVAREMIGKIRQNAAQAERN